MRPLPGDSLKVIRNEVVESMKEALASVEPVGVPAWIITLLIIPVWLWEGLKILWHFTFKVVVTYITLPVVSLYYLIDTLIVMSWFFRHIVKKMSERKSE